MILKQKIIITCLVVTLVVVFAQFVLVEKIFFPISQQEISESFQNGYNAGVENSITEIFQQTSNCNSTYIWIANNTRQLVDVACLQ